MADEEESTTRVAMIWPVDLKESVRQRVGSRGLTAFTLDAVREKLAREPWEGDTPPVEEEKAAEVEVAPAESAHSVPAAPVVADGESLPTAGVAARFSRSAGALDELRTRAEALGMKVASEIPAPTLRLVKPEEESLAAPEPEPEPEPVAVAVVPVRSIEDIEDIDAGF